VLLTGVGQPGQVGECVAGAFAARGDHVLLVDRRIEDSRARAADIAAPGLATAYAADLSDAADTDRLAAEVRARHGDVLDVVVHMAGGWQPGAKVAESSPDHWSRMIAINLMTAVNTARAFVPMLRPSHGSLVLFASEAALSGADVSGMSAYAATKTGVAVLMRAVAAEERRHGVRANALAPAAIRTASNEGSMGAGAAYVEREQVADAVLWLCSPAAGAVSGELIRLAAQPPASPARS
jgi:NAD(P)-dependent dehydrogenase (short-subunit alcohol dehydrogenase family)